MRFAPQHLPEDPPGQRADLVQLIHLLDLETRSVPASAPSSSSRKPALLAHAFVERSDTTPCPAAPAPSPFLPAPGKSRERPQNLHRIFHRFEHVHAQRACRIDRLHGSVIGRILRIQLADRHVRRAQKTVAQRVQIQRIAFRRRRSAICAPSAGRSDCPGPRRSPARVSPRCGRSTRVTQLMILRRSGQAVEQAAAVGGAHTDRPPARNTGSRPAPSRRPSSRSSCLLRKCGRDS